VVYAAGFYVSDMGGKSFKIYINTTTLDSDEVVLYCTNEMVKPKYNKFVYYVHNLAKYDVTFIIKTLVDYNYKVGYEHFKLKLRLRDQTILALEIEAKSYMSLDKNEDNYLKQ
jgi:hypothetical protein